VLFDIFKISIDHLLYSFQIHQP